MNVSTYVYDSIQKYFVIFNIFSDILNSNFTVVFSEINTPKMVDNTVEQFARQLFL